MRLETLINLFLRKMDFNSDISQHNNFWNNFKLSHDHFLNIEEMILNSCKTTKSSAKVMSLEFTFIGHGVRKNIKKEQCE